MARRCRGPASGPKRRVADLVLIKAGVPLTSVSLALSLLDEIVAEYLQPGASHLPSRACCITVVALVAWHSVGDEMWEYVLSD